MERNYTTSYPEADVYASVTTSPSQYGLPTDNQEFSLSGIQSKLGDVTAPEVSVDDKTSAPDLMPSNQTLNMSYERNYSSEKTASKVSTGTKALVIGYVAVVLVLVLVVSVCAVSVGEAFSSAVALDAQYKQVLEQIDSLQQQVSAEDYAALLNRAIELGYVDASNSNTQTYQPLETRPAQNFQVETNWFDSLCDWLCGVFGE